VSPVGADCSTVDLQNFVSGSFEHSTRGERVKLFHSGMVGQELSQCDVKLCLSALMSGCMAYIVQSG
jgi:hypothetical protein